MNDWLTHPSALTRKFLSYRDGAILREIRERGISGDSCKRMEELRRELQKNFPEVVRKGCRSEPC